MKTRKNKDKQRTSVDSDLVQCRLHNNAVIYQLNIKQLS